VTYRLGLEGGRTAEVLLMPREAFLPEPIRAAAAGRRPDGPWNRMRDAFARLADRVRMLPDRHRPSAPGRRRQRRPADWRRCRSTAGAPERRGDRRVPRLGDYGFAYCPPDGSEAIVGLPRRPALGGWSSPPATARRGPRASEPGEAMLFNAITGDFVKMCADGKIRSQGDWIHDGDGDQTSRPAYVIAHTPRRRTADG
jgi:hypothetical protein